MGCILLICQYSQPWIILFRDISHEVFSFYLSPVLIIFLHFSGTKMGQNFAETNKRIIPQERAWKKWFIYKQPGCEVLAKKFMLNKYELFCRYQNCNKGCFTKDLIYNDCSFSIGSNISIVWICQFWALNMHIQPLFSYPQFCWKLANILQKAVVLLDLASFSLVGSHSSPFHCVNVSPTKNLKIISYADSGQRLNTSFASHPASFLIDLELHVLLLMRCFQTLPLWKWTWSKEWLGLAWPSKSLSHQENSNDELNHLQLCSDW